MAVVLTNLSNRLYEESRFRLNASAGRFGVDILKSYSWEDLRTTDFYRDNKAILDQPTGSGYWLWKPYIIFEALQNAAEGDIIVYADSGLEIIAPLDALFTICRDQARVLLFGNGTFPNAMCTRRDCFILMDCDTEEYWKAPQCDAAFCIFRRCETSLRFVEEWLGYCRDPRIITDAPNTCGRRNLPEFVEHRRDQSVLSLLAQRHHLPLFRMPTQFGNHYKTHPFRLPAEFNCVNQRLQQQVSYYAVIPYYNSPYFQLLDHHRGHAKDGRTRTKNGSPFNILIRAISKRYHRWMNTFDLWRHKHQN